LPELRCLLCDRVLLDENAAVPSERCLQCGKLMQLHKPEHPSVPPGEQAGVMPGEGSLLTTAFDELPEAVPVVQPRVPPVLRVSGTPTPAPTRDVPVVKPRIEPPKPKWVPPIQMHPPVPPHEDEIERPKPKYGCALLVMLGFAIMALLAVTFVIYAIARGLRKLPKTEATPAKVVGEPAQPKAEKPKPLVPEVGAAQTQSLWMPPRGAFPLGTATANTNATIPLPGTCTLGVPAGNGRFILFPTPESRMIAVFDVATARIAGYLAMPDEKSLVAGSANHAFIVSPAQRMISRFDLSTLKMEMAGLLPDDIGSPLAVAVGPAARGPVYLLGAAKAEPSLHLLNPDTLATIDWKPAVAPFKKPAGVFTGGIAGQRAYLRTSASGRALLGGVAIGQQNYRVDRLDLVGAEPAISPTDIKIAAPAFPTADGGLSAFDTDPKLTRLPMAEGSGYFEIADKGGSKVLTMTFPGESHVQRAEVKGIEDFADDTGPDRDRRAFLIPSALALVYLSADGRSIHWRRVKVSEELPKLTQDYLVVTSTPPAIAVRGATFNHVLKILSNSKDALLKLDMAPAGMKAEGTSLVWEIPADYPLGDVPVEVAVESKLKPQVAAKLRFTLAVVANAPSRAGLFAAVPPEPRAGPTVNAGAAGDPLQFRGRPTGTVKRGQTYRTAITLGTPADANLSIVAGPPGMNWKGSDLAWEVPADFPGGPVPVVLSAQTAADRRVSYGFLIEVRE